MPNAGVRRYAFEGRRLLGCGVHSFLDKTSEATHDQRELKNELRTSRPGSLGLTPLSAPLPSIKLARRARSDRMDGGRCAPVVVRVARRFKGGGEAGPKHEKHVPAPFPAGTTILESCYQIRLWTLGMNGWTCEGMRVCLMKRMSIDLGPCALIEPPLSTDLSPFSKGENPDKERGLSKKASSNRL